ncbi:DoxX family protein [Larkinella bovis]
MRTHQCFQRNLPFIFSNPSPDVTISFFVGLLVSYTAIPLIGTMLVAMFTVHLNYGFSSVNTIGLTPNGPQFGPPGYEINLLYIAGLLSLMLTGAGVFSLDAVIPPDFN